MARRSEAMQVYLNACGLPAIIPLFLKQASDVETFLADTSCRLRSVRPSGSHTDGDAHYNNGWYDLLVPFFREIALVSIAPGPRFGPAALAAAAAAGCARATSMLAASAAPAAPAPALPFPPFAAPGPAPAYAPPPPPPPPAAPAVSWAQPVATAWPAAPPARAAAPPGQRKQRQPSLCIPGSPALVGPAIGFYPAPTGARGCLCAIGSTVAHWRFECPFALATLFGHPCPGFDANGQRIAAEWVGADLSPAARTSWRSLIARHNLLPPKLTGGRVPVF
jgi:hypothetical protein